MSLRSLAQSLKADPVPLVEVPTPELGPDYPSVWVRRMPGLEYLAYDRARYTRGADGKELTLDPDRAALALVVFTLAEKDGTRAFADDDFDAVGALPGSVIERVWGAAMEFNRQRAVDREEIRKNSSPVGVNGISSTESQPTTAGPSGNCLPDMMPSN